MTTTLINTITPSMTVAGAKRSKKFKSLLAVGFGEADALAKLGFTAPVTVDPNLALLIEAGFTPAEAAELLNNTTAEVTTAAPVVEVAKPVTSKDLGEALVAAQGYTFTKGRVYGTGATAEAIVRVLKTGTPEIVQSSGVGRSTAVLVYREASGDFAAQNLMTPQA